VKILNEDTAVLMARDEENRVRFYLKTGEPEKMHGSPAELKGEEGYFSLKGKGWDGEVKVAPSRPFSTEDAEEIERLLLGKEWSVSGRVATIVEKTKRKRRKPVQEEADG
jgi:hypothetical protein